MVNTQQWKRQSSALGLDVSMFHGTVRNFRSTATVAKIDLDELCFSFDHTDHEIS